MGSNRTAEDFFPRLSIADRSWTPRRPVEDTTLGERRTPVTGVEQLDECGGVLVARAVVVQFPRSDSHLRDAEFLG